MILLLIISSTINFVDKFLVSFSTIKENLLESIPQFNAEKRRVENKIKNVVLKRYLYLWAGFWLEDNGQC